MQRAQRTFGRFLKRAPNEADVEAMLTDFTDSESMLEKVCRAARRIAAAILLRDGTSMNWRGLSEQPSHSHPADAHHSNPHYIHMPSERP
jgi:hypothetical protein